MESETRTACGRKSRRTTNLSPDQILRKRATDRVNQRAYRAKNKVQIRCLEDRIAELTYRLNKAKTELARREDIIQQLGGSVGECDPVSPDSTWGTAGHNLEETPLHTSPKDGDPAPDPGPEAATSGGGDIFHGLETFLDTIALDFGTGFTPNYLLGTAQELLSFDREAPEAVNDLGRGGSQRAAICPENDTPGPSLSTTVPSGSAEDLPVWQRSLPHIPPTSRLDEIIVNSSLKRERFTQTARQVTEFTWPRFPSIASLLNRSSESDGEPRPLSDELAALVERTSFRFLVERIALMYKLSHLLRWIVCRTKETYDAMPTYLQPTQLQLTTPHPAWVDVLTWPEARDAIIREMDWDQFDLFFELTGQTVSVGWPFPDSGAFVESPDGQLVMPHPLFEEHIRKLENWTCGKAVVEAFPFMKVHCRD